MSGQFAALTPSGEVGGKRYILPASCNLQKARIKRCLLLFVQFFECLRGPRKPECIKRFKRIAKAWVNAFYGGPQCF